MKEFRREIPIPSPERLAALTASESPSCWLDSALTAHPASRISIFVHKPMRSFRAESEKELSTQVLEWDRVLRSVRGLLDPSTSCAGGLFGFFSYPSRHRRTALPAAQFYLAETGLLIDHCAGRAFLFSLGMEEDLCRADAALAEVRCQELERAIDLAGDGDGALPRPRSLRAAMARESYLAKVRDIQQRIFRGDCYQVNFSQRFVAEGDWDPAAVYLRLRAESPAPQMAFFNLGFGQILSASPETLLEIEGRCARSYPIKGTRPRHSDPDLDSRLAQALLKSPKDAAELLMIVDLVRNDLGRICEIGSISVPKLKKIDSLSQVHHLYAQVEGRLREDVGPLSALWALSPGGSITGAPKLKAMEIIEELEEGDRGIYTGSVGFAAFDGTARFNIAIRSAWLQGTRLEYSAGGGIVADSDPVAEYEECLHKAQGLFQALGAQPTLG